MDTAQRPSPIDWHRIDDQRIIEPVLVTSQHFPGWFDIGAPVLGEWRRGQIAGDRMEHEPTHYALLTPIEKRHMS